MINATVPEITIAGKVILVCVLKSIFIHNLTLGTIIKEFIIMFRLEP